MSASALPAPERGDHVRRVGDGNIGTVDLVAKPGDLYHLPLYPGDVVVWLEHGRSIVTSAGIFWEKWERVDVEVLAREAILLALEAA